MSGRGRRGKEEGVRRRKASLENRGNQKHLLYPQHRGLELRLFSDTNVHRTEIERPQQPLKKKRDKGTVEEVCSSRQSKEYFARSLAPDTYETQVKYMTSMNESRKGAQNMTVSPDIDVRARTA